VVNATNATWNFNLNEGAIFFGSEPFATACIENLKNLCNGLTYTITLEIGNLVNTRIAVNIGGVYSDFIFSEGTWTFDIDAPNSGPCNLQICAYVLNRGTGTATIRRVIVQLSESGRPLTQFPFDKFSDVISVGDYLDECKFAGVSACFGQDAFNFDTSLPEGLRLSARFEYRKFQPQYDSDIESFRYSSGRFRATYVDIKKKWRFNFGRIPEYLLDFFSIALFSDSLNINGLDYYPAETELPTITYNDSDSYGEMNVELYKRKEKLLKTFCTNGDC
jgi:hypothetical protein